ncbi:MAG: hypothetical protein AAGA21_08410 [Pseudomonadota bacterium]
MNNDKYNVRELSSKYLRIHKLSTKFWSFLHHSFLFGAALLSACAALILTIDNPSLFISDADLAAILSAIAAFMGVISGSGGFQRKWETNRETLSELKQIEIDLMSENINIDGVKMKLKEIIYNHDKGILGKEKTKSS